MTRSVTHCACGDHAFVTLTKGFVALFSPQYAGYIGLWNWSANTDGRNWYAARNITRTIGGKKHALTVKMHRALMPIPSAWMIDHENGNGLDNRDKNLRPASVAQNNSNQKARNTSSPFKGVSKAQGRWRAAISVDGEFHYIGLFDNQEDAARAYDEVAVQLRGEFARVNFPNTSEIAA